VREILRRIPPSVVESDGALRAILERVAEIPALVKALEPVAEKYRAEPVVGSAPVTSTHHRSPEPIDLDRVLVVPKLSKVQFDMIRYGWTYEELLEKYATGTEDKRRILASHARQVAALAVLEDRLDPEQIVRRDQPTVERLRSASLVIAFGGDNHFQFVAQRVAGQTPLWGVNSDPRTSFGALLGGNADGLDIALDRLARGDYRFEPWTRVEVEVDGVTLPPALCDVFLGERERRFMSRHRLEFVSSGTSEVRSMEQKSSGLLIATGAGSSGWSTSAARYLFPEGIAFPRADRSARYLLTEASSALPGLKGGIPPGSTGIIREDGELTVHSLNDSDGFVSVDSLTDAPFPRGSKAVIRLAREPLWVPCLDESS